MLKFGEFIARHRALILVIGILLLFPAAIGYINTRVNYDILSYLPDDIETMQGQLIATRPYIGQYLDVSQMPEGFYQLRSLNRKGITHRLGFFMIKRR